MLVVRVVTSDAADIFPREILCAVSHSVPQSVLVMHNALHRHVPCAGERSPFPSAALLAHSVGSSSGPILLDRRQLWSTGMFP